MPSAVLPPPARPTLPVDAGTELGPAGRQRAAVQAAADAPLLWESMVTDGHVRALRLRRVQPWIVGISLVLLWLGFWIASRAPAVRADASAATDLQARLAKSHARANAALSALPRLPAGTPIAGALPPLAEVASLVAQTLQSLDKAGELPRTDIDFVETDRNALWKGDWAAERVHYARSGDVMLVAANVNAGSAARVQPMRWMGAFKKFGERWQYTSLAGAGFFAPREYPAVQPAQISQSLASLLPDER